MSVRVCNMILRYCKRGHLRTMETTFERNVVVRKNGREYHYVARECRICHSIRNSRPPKICHNSRSKWLAAKLEANQ